MGTLRNVQACPRVRVTGDPCTVRVTEDPYTHKVIHGMLFGDDSH